MLEVLVRLLNVPVDVARVVRTDLTLAGRTSPLWMFLLALALVALAAGAYGWRVEAVSRGRKITLAALRAAFLLMLLGLLLRPVLSFTIEGTVRRTLVLLLDGSQSMRIEDRRTEEADVKRLAIAANVIDPGKGLQQRLPDPAALRPASRLDVLKAALRNSRLKLVEQLARDYELAAFTFDRAVAEIAAPAAPQPPQDTQRRSPLENLAWLDRLEATGPATALGDAVREVLWRKRGQPLAGIVIATDGANNSGSVPLEAAALARQDGVPLYIYGVGIGSPRDVIVGKVFAQEVAFVKDEVPVTVRVRGQGMAGQTSRLILRLGGQEVDEQEITFRGDGEQVATMRFTPQQQGEFELAASIEPRDDEVVKDNNSASASLRVVDGKIKVLMIEQSPRWEFKYLQAMLYRDRRVELKCLLVEGDPQLARGEGSPYLERFPQDKQELFKFDVIILGDVDPRFLSAGQMESLSEYVSRFGGAMVMIAGRRFAPAGYARTPIERMLPVEFDAATAEASGQGVFSKPVRLELTAAGRASAMMRISDNPAENVQRWASLPPVYWVARVSRAKPAAEVLLVDSDPSRASRFGKMPVVAIQQYGVGQVLYVGTDNTWRWRRNAGDRYHTMFWGQLVQRMAMAHLLGSSKRTQLSSDRKQYVSFERVTVYARLYKENFEPVTEPTIGGVYMPVGADATPSAHRRVTLRAMPEQPGMYRGEFVAPAAGTWQFHVDRDPATRLDFVVAEPRLELDDTAMNESMLKEMAASTGGAFVREEDLHHLPQIIGSKSERVRSSVEVELWATPLYFLLALALVTAEWVVRKMSQLK